MDQFNSRHDLRRQFDALRISLMLMLTVIAVNLAARLLFG
jgi:hypothetical protein